MVAAVWLMLSGLMYALQLSTGSFPKPLTEEEESYYLDRVEKGTSRRATFSSSEICALLPIL